MISKKIQIKKPDNLEPKTELLFELLFDEKYKEQNKRQLVFDHFVKPDLIKNLHDDDDWIGSDGMVSRSKLKVAPLKSNNDY